MHQGLPWWGGESGSSTRMLQLAAKPTWAPLEEPSGTPLVGEASDCGSGSSSTSTSISSSRCSTSQLQVYGCLWNVMKCKLSQGSCGKLKYF